MTAYLKNLKGEKTDYPLYTVFGVARIIDGLFVGDQVIAKDSKFI